MPMSRRAQAVIWNLAIPGASLAIMLGLGYSLFNGERGLKRLAQIDQQLTLHQVYRDELKIERERLEQRVAMLQERTLNFDLLDERLRAMLNVIRPGETVVIYPKALTPIPGKDRPAPQD
jgi:cell division protein FtsB